MLIEVILEIRVTTGRVETVTKHVKCNLLVNTFKEFKTDSWINSEVKI
jgi:hypothetical protein